MMIPASHIPSSIWHRLFAHLPDRRKWQSIVMLCLMLVGALAEVLTLGAILPFLTAIANPDAVRSVPLAGNVMRHLGVVSNTQILTTLASFFCVVVIIAAIIRILLAWLTQKFVFRLGYDLGIAVYQRILSQPYQYHLDHSSSEVIATINKVQNVVNGVLMPLMTAITSSLIATAILVGMILVKPIVALFTGIIFGGIYATVSALTRKRLRSNSVYISKAQKLRVQTVQEGIGGIRDVLIEHAQPIYVEKFSKIDSSLRDAQAANALIAASPRFLIEGLGMILIVLLALYLSAGSGGLSDALPVLGALALGAQRLLPLLQAIYNGWSQFMGNQASLVNIVETLELPTNGYSSWQKVGLPMPFTSAIKFDSVGFSYNDSFPAVLKGLTLKIPKGSKVGFIGKTGSGKSTTIDLLMGLLTPTAGRVLVDDTALQHLNIRSWQQQVAHVPQNIYLSDTTILENIAFGVPRAEIDISRVKSAANRAEIGDYITSQPMGFDTMIGERGVRLSGGQRQRLGIARALYKQSSLLIFDEATSALDDQTEASVIESINRLDRDLTVVMIAHRLSTLRGCDIIYKLEGGIVSAQGTYDEVIRPLSTHRHV